MTTLHRGARAAFVGLGLGLVVALAGPASAHVTVQPGQAEAGSYTVVSFRVPTERDDASTTKVSVVLPEDQPVASVRTTPVPGWTVRTTTRTLDTPLDQHGTRIDQVVSKVTWTAEGGGIRTGEFEDFPISLGPLPDTGELVFKAFQTYDDGKAVAWNEVSVDPSVEPEHPAPVLTLIASGESGATDSPSPSATDSRQVRADKREAGTSASEGTDPLALGLSLVALLLGAAALFTSLRGRSS